MNFKNIFKKILRKHFYITRYCIVVIRLFINNGNFSFRYGIKEIESKHGNVQPSYYLHLIILNVYKIMTNAKCKQ